MVFHNILITANYLLFEWLTPFSIYQGRTMKKNKLIPLLSSALLSLTVSHSALADQVKMPSSAAVCMSCHGATGMGMPNVAPMIAGLDPEYFNEQIKLFKTTGRSNPTMKAMAGTIPTDEESNKLALYYASLGTPALTKIEKRGDQVIIKNPAKKLVYQGDWSRDIPACATCHGPSTLGVDHFPRLAGQHADYIKSQLIDWQKGTRSGDADNVMGSIAKKLTTQEIDQLANYLSALK